MAKFTPENIASGFQSTEALNANFTQLETLSNTFLSRDGTSPNTMLANLDMNSQRIINLPSALSPSEPITYAQFLALRDILPFNGTVIEKIDATAGQTVFNLGAVSYVPGSDNITVYRNGLYIDPGQYIETASDTITLSYEANLGDEFVFVVNQRAVGADVVAASSVTYTDINNTATNVEAALDDMAETLAESVPQPYFPEIMAKDVRVDGVSSLWTATNVATALKQLAGFTDRMAMFKGSGYDVDGSDKDCDNLVEPKYYKIRNIQNMPSGYTEGELVVFTGQDEYLQLFYHWIGTYQWTVQFRIFSGAVAAWTPWLAIPVATDYSYEFTGNVDSLRTEGSYTIEPSAYNLPTGETRGGLVVRTFSGVLYQQFFGYSGHAWERVLNGRSGAWSAWRATSSGKISTYTGDLDDLKYDLDVQCAAPTNRPAGETNGCLEVKLYINFVTQKWYGASTNKSFFRIYDGTSNVWGSWVQESN